MTQNEMQRLLIRIIDEFQWIVWYQEFLRIAVEQLDNPDNRTVDRVELLLSSYLEQSEPHFNNLTMYIRQRDEVQESYLISE